MVVNVVTEVWACPQTAKITVVRFVYTYSVTILKK